MGWSLYCARSMYLDKTSDMNPFPSMLNLTTDWWACLYKVSTITTDLMAWSKAGSEMESQSRWSAALTPYRTVSFCPRISGLMGWAFLTFSHFHLFIAAISVPLESCSLLLTWPLRCSHEQLLNQAARMACWKLSSPRHWPCLKKCSWKYCITDFIPFRKP